jgi:hypothetical protein
VLLLPKMPQSMYQDLHRQKSQICDSICDMTTRKAVPLSSEEISMIEEIRVGAVFSELAGHEATRSEASALHALVRLGIAQVKEQEELVGYAALAAAQDDEDRAFAQAVRGRRRGGNE